MAVEQLFMYNRTPFSQRWRFNMRRTGYEDWRIAATAWQAARLTPHALLRAPAGACSRSACSATTRLLPCLMLLTRTPTLPAPSRLRNNAAKTERAAG